MLTSKSDRCLNCNEVSIQPPRWGKGNTKVGGDVCKTNIATARLVEWKRRKKGKENRKWLGVWKTTPLFSQCGAHLGFRGSVGKGETILSFSSRVLGSRPILCPSHHSFPGVLNPCEPELSPRAGRRSGSDEQGWRGTECGPKQDARHEGSRRGVRA